MTKEALLIVDMSNDFVADHGTLTVGKPGQEIVPYIKHLATRFLAEGNVVVVSMDAHQPDDPHFELWPPHNIVDTEGQQLYGELNDWFETHKEHENVIYSPKTNYNAFFQTDLAEKLRGSGVEKVHIVGVTTDICDFLTVAGADAEGFKTTIHRRGVATFTDLGDTMLNHMKRCFHTEVIE
ncbi:cysteine hydrolase family protein [Niallia sp. Krafla_26]|uniref:cysteine hydrolase family protein n=1 Tax=Niallia sp. Krafla_26 TaxID=3064703 RepID=UPI003D175525